MLRTTFSSIQDMLEYNYTIVSALEMLWGYESEKWNDNSSEKICDPLFNSIYFDEDMGMFLIPCWLSCDVTYTGGFADNDPYIPYTVDIPLQRVEDYLKENYGYDPYIVTADPTYVRGFVAGMRYKEESHRQQMIDAESKREDDIKKQ